MNIDKLSSSRTENEFENDSKESQSEISSNYYDSDNNIFNPLDDGKLPDIIFDKYGRKIVDIRNNHQEFDCHTNLYNRNRQYYGILALHSVLI